MELREYQSKAVRTALYRQEIESYTNNQGEEAKREKLHYAVVGLLSEAGELAGEVKRTLRDDAGQLTDQRRSKVLAELGDILWYVAAVADELGADLNEVAEANIAKLASRAERGVLHGEGGQR